MSLVKYREKRHFKDTPEPSGRLKKSRTKQLEFVVQKHHASHLHYDFRLEMDGVLKSWAVPKGPSLNPQDKRLAMMVEDHPYAYRKFEGVIPEGNYGAGNVIIWDKGTYQARKGDGDEVKTLRQELSKGHLTFILHGQKLKGEFALVKKNGLQENAWLLIKKNDEYASVTDVTKKDKSVISGRAVDDDVAAGKVDLEGAPKGAILRDVKPMLATLSDEPFDGDNWLFEIKWDGYRAIGSWDGKAEELYSRNGNDFRERYGEISEALRQLSHRVVLDGEVVVINEDGQSNFGWLQNWGRTKRGTLTYYVFDILWCDNHDLRSLPLIRRKQILESILAGNDIIRYSDHIKARGEDFFKKAQEADLEGSMAKSVGSQYQEDRRSQSWLKIKTHQRQEAVIGGFTEPRGSRQHIGALILGVYEGHELRYVGHTGGGIPTEMMPELKERLENIEIKDSPFSEKVKPNAPVHWVKPEAICEVRFSEWTADGHMRQPIFIGMRSDKSPLSIVEEKPVPAATIKEHAKTETTASGQVEFSHLDKVFFPKRGFTKGDLVDYYSHMGPRMLKYLKERPHSLLRQPNGVTGQAFFQKDMLKVPGFIRTIKIYSESNEKDINYLVCDSLEALLYMVQLGCIEINPWNSRVASLENPDWLVIDLDPEKIGFNEVIKVAKALKQTCDELEIPSYPKTSGKTGIHIFMPLQAKYDYEQTKQFAEILANLVHQKVADTTSLERSPSKRQGKIYIDFLQNREGQTLAAPYSVRPTDSANVSTPLHWEEVNEKLRPEKFNIRNIFKRLDEVGELWCPVVGKGIDIGKVLAKIT